MTPDEMKALVAEARLIVSHYEADDATGDFIERLADALEAVYDAGRRELAERFANQDKTRKAAIEELIAWEDEIEQLDEEGLVREMVSAINSERDTEPGWTLTPRGNERMVRVCARAAMGEIAPLIAEVRRLRAWKAEAMQVLSEWDATYEAVGSPGRLGQSKAVALREEIERLRALSSHPDEETDWEYRRVTPAGNPRRDAIFESPPDLDEGWTTERRAVGPWEPVPEGSETV